MKWAFLATALFAVSLFAKPDERKNLELFYSVGDLENLDGVAHICKVYPGHAKIGGEKGEELANIWKLTDEAMRQPIDEAVHVKATSPSIQYYARITLKEGKTSKYQIVELITDHSTTRTRRGEAAKTLVEKINSVCAK